MSLLVRFSFVAGGVYGLVATLLGALTAHRFPQDYEPEAIETLETAVRFAFYHALLLISSGILLGTELPLARRLLAVAVGLVVAGTFLFSGSIFGLVLQGWTWLGPITPLGGGLLILGWLFVILSVLRSRA